MFLENFYLFLFDRLPLGEEKVRGDRNCTICFCICIWYLLYLTAGVEDGGNLNRTMHKLQKAKMKSGNL